MKITLGLVFFWITIVHISDAVDNNEYLHRVKRIIGNTKPVDSKVHKFQHVVTLTSIMHFFEEETFFGFLKLPVLYVGERHCGASMLSNEWVITAAHCLLDQNGNETTPSDWTIYLHGVKRKPDLIERLKAWWAESMKIFGVKRPKNLHFQAQPQKFYLHPKYDKIRHFNDIALIKINPVDLEEIYDSGPINLPPLEVTKVSGPKLGEKCWYAGWGCTEANGYFIERLLEAKFQIVQLDKCVYYYGRKIDSKEEWKDKLCVQARNTSICAGDSGGGLSCKSKNGKMYLAGIASSGAAGNNPERYPSNFIKVSNYVDWIMSIVKKL